MSPDNTTLPEDAAFRAECICAGDLLPRTHVVAIDSFKRALARLSATTAVGDAEVERVAHAAIAVEYEPERYADQARAGNWPIWRVAVAAARNALRESNRHGE